MARAQLFEVPYDAGNASQLNEAFRDIVRRLNTLRMTS